MEILNSDRVSIITSWLSGGESSIMEWWIILWLSLVTIIAMLRIVIVKKGDGQ